MSSVSVIDGLGTIALFDKVFGSSKDDARITALEQRVTSIESDMTELKSDVKTMSSKLDSFGSTQEAILNEIRAMRNQRQPKPRRK